MLSAGKLNKRVSIKAQTTSRDSLNQKQATWSTIVNGDVWAAVEPLSNREAMEARANQTELSHRVTIRYRTDVTADMRIQYGTRSLAITGIRDPGERHEYLEILCIEGKHV